MLNKLQLLSLLLLLSCSSVSGYAYIIGTNLSIENRTNVNLTISIDSLNLEPPITQALPAHKTSIIYLENGDHTGWLYQTSATIFKIKSANNKVYAKGRIVFHVGGSLWKKYSFLDAVASAEGLQLSTRFSCVSGGDNTLNNKIIIDGTLQGELKPTPFPNEMICEGLQSSLTQYKNSFYNVTCSNGDTEQFWKSRDRKLTDTELWAHIYTNSDQTYYIYTKNEVEDKPQFQTVLDRQLGKPYCNYWKIANSGDTA